VADLPRELNHTFTAPIGVDVKGDIWDCVEVPDSKALLGTGRSVKVDAAVDEVELESIGLMPTGTGGHMLSLNAGVRKRIGKERGDSVTVTIRRQLT